MKKKINSERIYREDLAHIHIEGYGFHWEAAAPLLLQWLRDHDIRRGLVVDLGCGGGQWLARLMREGYETCGIDVSPDMIRRARRVASKATFIRGSFAELDIPYCDAVTSIGEPMNYLNSGILMRRTIRNVFASLRAGGLFIFDVRHPPTSKVNPINHCMAGDSWFCHARIEETPNRLIRHITTFRRVGDNRYRRDQETHRLKLFSKHQMLHWLRNTGFRVRTRRSYGRYRLAARQSVFVCRKPS